MFKGTPTRRQHHDRARHSAAWTSTARPGYDRTNYFETFPRPTRTSTGRSARSRPHGQLLHRAQGPRQRDDGRAQRVRARREQPGRILIAAHDRDRVRWHNYGKDTIGARSDIEQRRHRPPAGVLPPLLPAGQRGAGRRRQVRSGARRSRWSRKYFGPIPKPTRVLPRPLHARSRCRTASAQVTLRRVGDAQWLAALYHTVRGRASRLRSRSRRPVDADDRSRPAGRLYKALVETKKAAGRRRLRLQRGTIPASRCSSRRCPTRIRSTPARDAHAARRSKASRRSRSPRPKLERVRAKALQVRSTTRSTIRSGSASRCPKSIAQGDWRLFFLRRDRWRKVTPADVERVAVAYFKRGEPHGRRVHSRRQARPRAGAAGGRRRRAGQGLQGRRRDRRRRSVRRDARQSRRAHAALHARRTA